VTVQAEKAARFRAFVAQAIRLAANAGLAGSSPEDLPLGRAGSAVRNVDRPVNVLVGLRGASLTLADLFAFGAVVRAAEEMQTQGTFAFADDAPPLADMELP
jgi:hypothetical protein